MIRCIPVPTCAQCPYRQRHYGQDECSQMNFQALPKLQAENGIVTSIPDWCPLPPHPSFAAQAAKGKDGLHQPTAHSAPRSSRHKGAAMQCESCDHKGEGERFEHCRLFTFAPTKPCTHNTFAPAASAAMRMQFVDRLAAQRAQAQEKEQ